MIPDSLTGLRDRLRVFARERDWEQFHTPKNLSCALSVEVGELLEQFQWTLSDISDPPDETKRERIADEIADVLIYAVRLADVLDIDPIAAADRKLEKNARRYPVDRAKGKATKYTEL
jgi:NTP pyrophosphatase (non-canonical NTP hydrolase)